MGVRDSSERKHAARKILVGAETLSNAALGFIGACRLEVTMAGLYIVFESKGSFKTSKTIINAHQIK